MEFSASLSIQLYKTLCFIQLKKILIYLSNGFVIRSRNNMSLFKNGNTPTAPSCLVNCLVLNDGVCVIIFAFCVLTANYFTNGSELVQFIKIYITIFEKTVPRLYSQHQKRSFVMVPWRCVSLSVNLLKVTNNFGSWNLRDNQNLIKWSIGRNRRSIMSKSEYLWVIDLCVTCIDFMIHTRTCTDCRANDIQQELDEYTENSAQLEKELEASLVQVEKQNRDLEHQNQRLKSEIEILRVSVSRNVNHFLTF